MGDLAQMVPGLVAGRTQGQIGIGPEGEAALQGPVPVQKDPGAPAAGRNPEPEAGKAIVRSSRSARCRAA